MSRASLIGLRRASSIISTSSLSRTAGLRVRSSHLTNVARYSTRIPAGRRSRLPPRLYHDNVRRREGRESKDVVRDGQDDIRNETEASSTPSKAETVAGSTTAKDLPVLRHATIVVPRSDESTGVIDSDESARQSVEAILGQPSLVVTREIEMLNVFMGYEQANKYAIITPDGHQLGYLAESESGLLGGALRRQFLRTHRAFEARIIDPTGRVVLTIKRPTTVINSRLKVFIGDGEDESRLVGEVHQVWHPFRRKYELFVNRPELDESTGHVQDSLVQFASIDGGLLTWDFVMTDERERPLGAITRNFRGFGREIFTDTGQYVLTFDPTASPDLRLEAPSEDEKRSERDTQSLQSSNTGRELVTSGPARQLTMDERAVALATAVSVDFDYFSRHSSHGHGTPGMAMFPWMWGGGGGASPTAEPTPPSPSSPNTGAGMQNGDGEAPLPSSNDPGSDNVDDRNGGAQESPWWEQSNDNQSHSQDSGSGQEDYWGSHDPWQQSSGGGGGDSGWSWTDLFPGDE